MSTAKNQRIPVNKVVLILGLLLAVWLVFQFWPQRKPIPPQTPVMAESNLRSVGLPDNVDFEGLPEFFAVWADHAEWKDGKTQFAYWNSVSRSYADFFEAIRESGKVRFRPIAKNESFRFIEIQEDGNFALPGDPKDMAKYAYLDSKSESSTHPFAFFRSVSLPKSGPYIPPNLFTPADTPTRVQIEIPPVPNRDAGKYAPPDEQKKK